MRKYVAVQKNKRRDEQQKKRIKKEIEKESRTY